MAGRFEDAPPSSIQTEAGASPAGPLPVRPPSTDRPLVPSRMHARRTRPRPVLAAVLVLLVLSAGVLTALHRSERPAARPAPNPPAVQLRLWIDGKPVRVGGTTTLLGGHRYAIAVQLSTAQDVTVTDSYLLVNGPRAGSVGGHPSGNFVRLAYQARSGNPSWMSTTWTATSVAGSAEVSLAALYSVAQGPVSASVETSLQAMSVR